MHLTELLVLFGYNLAAAKGLFIRNAALPISYYNTYRARQVRIAESYFYPTPKKAVIIQYVTYITLYHDHSTYRMKF